MNAEKQSLLENLKRQGFSKPILEAFIKVKREDFILKDMKKLAYEDIALSIGNGQTISQPYTIATMFSLLELKKGQKVLEVGSGCGYALALISKIVGQNGNVFGIERIKELAKKSKLNLKEYKNIEIYNQNGFYGLKEKAPFSRILISAGYPKIPKPLIRQLKDKGIIVAPIGNRYEQSLIVYEKIKGKLEIKKEIPGFVFVPLRV